jgi:hypothetical protein
MQLIKIKDKHTQKNFLDVPKILYQDDKNFVCPLDAEINSIFDPQKNQKLENGEAARWVLKNNKNELIGRIAAFIDSDYYDKYEQPTGGMGFFECMNDEKAAFLLFDTAKEWLEERGMKAMDGPINFGANDSYWGLLLEGFMPPAFGMPYNPEYYRDLFEKYGFKIYYKQFSYHINLDYKEFPERFWKIADWILQKPGYQVKYFSKKNKGKFVKDFVEIYNTTWPTFKDDFTPIQPEEVRKVIDDAEDIIIEEFIIFAYHNGKPVGFYVNFPDINQILKDMNGKLNFWNKLKLFYRLKFTKKITRLRGIIYGIAPGYQKSGIDAGIFRYMQNAIDKRPHFREVELSWVGDFNPKMINMWERFNAYKVKEYATYRYLFDRNAEFKRYPIPELKK